MIVQAHWRNLKDGTVTLIETHDAEDAGDASWWLAETFDRVNRPENCAPLVCVEGDVLFKVVTPE